MITVSALSVYHMHLISQGLGCSLSSSAKDMIQVATEAKLSTLFSSRISYSDFLELKSATLSKAVIHDRIGEFFEVRTRVLGPFLFSPNVPDASVGEIIRNRTQSEPLFSEVWHTQLVRASPHYEIVVAPNVEINLPWEYILERMLDNVWNLGQLLGPSWKPIALRFSNRYPKRWHVDRLHKLEEICGCPLFFSSDTNAICLSSETLNQRIYFPHKAAITTQDEEIDKLRASLRPVQNFPEIVREYLRKHSYRQLPTASDAYQSLGIHPRLFQRSLKFFGTTFGSLRDEILYQKFQELSRDKSLRKKDLSRYLGFADEPSFYRALRRWKRAAGNGVG